MPRRAARPSPHRSSASARRTNARAPADADGYHSLIQTRADRYEMPPLATVTLESVQQPGEWEGCGHKVKRRLFTVSVSFK